MRLVKRIAAIAAIIAAALAIAYVILAVVDAPASHASGPCLFQGDWNCYGPPQYNGPLMPTWELPGGYGFPGGDPVQCNPVAYQCYPVAGGRY